jgi:hypothetical protein
MNMFVRTQDCSITHYLLLVGKAFMCMRFLVIFLESQDIKFNQSTIATFKMGETQ